jgi:cytoskeletal protein CcmA (bactofilin family)
MWKRKDEEPPPPPTREILSPPPPPKPMAAEPPREPAVMRSGMATIGKGLAVKGSIGGSEDLYVDGEVEGAIELRENNITIGPNGKVHANVTARDIVVLGRIKGNVRAGDRLELRKTGSLIGDIVTARIIIEDGAYFKGSIDIQKPGVAAAPPAPAPAATTPRPEVRAASVGSGLPGAPVAAPPPAPASPQPTPLQLSGESKQG